MSDNSSPTHVTIRTVVSTGKRDELQARADAKGLKLSTYLRMLIHDHLRGTTLYYSDGASRTETTG